MFGKSLLPVTLSKDRWPIYGSRCWALADFDIRESFLELGGNSLMAVQLISRVRDMFEVDVPVGEFLRTPTVLAMAESIALAQAQASEVPGLEDLLSEIEALRVDEAAALLAKEAESRAESRK